MNYNGCNLTENKKRKSFPPFISTSEDNVSAFCSKKEKPAGLSLILRIFSPSVTRLPTGGNVLFAESSFFSVPLSHPPPGQAATLESSFLPSLPPASQAGGNIGILFHTL